MRLIRNRADARWHPGRFQLATFRLIAFLMSRKGHRRDQAGLVLAIDRHQTAFENYLMAIWFAASLSFYAFALLRIVLQPWIAAVIAFPLAMLATQVLDVVIGLACGATLKSHDHIGVATAVMIGATLTLSLWIATTSHWTRFVGAAAIAGAALNAVAAVILRLLDARVEALEHAYET